MSSDTPKESHNMEYFRPLARSDRNSAAAPRLANLVPKAAVGCILSSARQASVPSASESRHVASTASQIRFMRPLFHEFLALYSETSVKLCN